MSPGSRAATQMLTAPRLHRAPRSRIFGMLVLVPSSIDPQEDFELLDATPSKEILLTQIAGGSQLAFASLYDEMSSRVLGLIRRLLVDHAQSEEVAQEVFLEIWQSASRFDQTKGGASTWILTMAHRRAVDRIRSSQAGRNRDTKIGMRDFTPDYDQVAEAVEITIEHERVKKAMSQLTELQRQAVSLAYYGGYSHSEVAELLSVPIGTVKTRLRDGMIRLRDHFGVSA